MPGKGHSPEQVLNKLRQVEVAVAGGKSVGQAVRERSEEHTSELQSRRNLVCRLLLEKTNTNTHSSSPET